MLRSGLAVLYTALMFGANPAAADVAAADALRDGDMKKLAFAAAAEIPQAALLTLDDQPASLSDYGGKWVLVNFWATWCPPCRKEMPGLDRLQAEMGDRLSVVTVATGRNPVPAIRKFWDEAGIENLPVLRDPGSELARGMGVMGLPVTVILNPEGQEVGRLIGDAEWDSPEAIAVLTALTGN
ncbi:TlpA family protein disulfide reductase [Aliigemmobacter aestuarii]|uniref:TlpA family protein disulfide reductase n=1 Tax=Aliigemmobacter aestuarii TaxID=1445661 RepID=A0A4S3MMB3_9RHOB|nr:TlpA disulfide reductase family protein [Gemmobacter aestuarii]THD83566.1 TlpA family protein disulfide reductase [Gemmobacter aestuarii]